ncbi:MAG TPA: glycosyltransferase family 4 protein [bacterium]|nr:glycosyltransferase family 4 protein [bacterium]HOL46673.1 glycosyltransferase family 4 protein [bacterium]HPQ18361.1 glycosyltransferase family 4 protein [bacterium]
MKILHIITKLELGGAQKNTLANVIFLQHHYETHLISGLDGILNDYAKKNIKNFFEIKELIREINLKNDFIALLKIIKYIKKNRFDIVHTHSSKAGILGRFAAFICKTPLIIHSIHGWSFNSEQKFLTRYFFILLEKLFSFFTNIFIAVSIDCIKVGLKRINKNIEKYVLIHSGINFEEIYNGAKEENLWKEIREKCNILDDEKIIGTISCYKPQKNLIDFIYIADEIAKHYKNVRFIIIGDGEQRKQIEDKIKELNLSKKIILTGWLLNPYGILNHFDFFVLTSLWEGLPRVFVEATLLEIPILTYEIEGANEIIKNNFNGFIFKKKDYKGIAAKILDLLKNNEEYNKIKENIKQQKKLLPEDFDINKMNRKILNLYKDNLRRV